MVGSVEHPLPARAFVASNSGSAPTLMNPVRS